MTANPVPSPADGGAAEARAQVAARDAFLDHAGHQLRTPLTPAMMLVHLMLDDPALPAHLKEHVALLRETIELEASLIDELVDLGRLARGRLAIVREAGVDVDALLREALARHAPAAAAKRTRIVPEPGATRTVIVGDASRLRRLFDTLIVNAIAHAGGTVVTVSSREVANGIEVQVADGGRGAQQADLDRALAQPFSASGTARVATRLGVGLALGAEIARLHGGSLTASSAGPGTGARFTVTLPRDRGAR